MGFLLTSNDYVEYIRRVAKRIADDKEYITDLDATTGGGDHWVNLNMGFTNLVAAGGEMKAMPIADTFKKIGSIMINIGGSSGVLYGGAYLAASKSAEKKDGLTSRDLCMVLEAMVSDIMIRGKAEPGYKTMIDALYPAVQAYKAALINGMSDKETMEFVKEAAISGAESTRGMEAVKGRASYQTNKGVGCLDPGAVTMSYQIECLCDYIMDTLP